MYLVRARNYEERLNANDALTHRVAGYDFSWIDVHGRERKHNISTLMASLLLPEKFDSPPQIEQYQVAAMLDTLVGREVISAAVAHNAFSVISPHVHLELFHIDRATQCISLPEPTPVAMF